MELSIINQSDLTKSSLKDFVKQIESLVESGNENSLEILQQIAVLENLIKTVKASKLIKEDAIEEASKFHKDERKRGALEFDVVEAGVKYDYTKSEIWMEYQRQIFELRESQKEIETLARLIKKPSSWIDDEGEERIVYPAVKKSTTTLKFTLK